MRGTAVSGVGSSHPSYFRYCQKTNPRSIPSLNWNRPTQAKTRLEWATRPVKVYFGKDGPAPEAGTCSTGILDFLAASRLRTRSATKATSLSSIFDASTRARLTAVSATGVEAINSSLAKYRLAIALYFEMPCDEALEIASW